MALSMPPEEFPPASSASDSPSEAPSPFALGEGDPAPVAASDLIDGVTPESIALRLDRLERSLAALHTNLADEIAQRLREDVPTARPEPPPKVPVAQIAAGPPPQTPRVEREPEPEVQSPRSRSWLWWEIMRDGGRTFYMLIDSRYRMSWSTRVVVIGLLAFILLPQWWNPLHLILGIVPFIQEIVDKAIIVILCFFLYKVLNRELLRYKDFLDDRNRRR